MRSTVGKKISSAMHCSRVHDHLKRTDCRIFPAEMRESPPDHDRGQTLVRLAFWPLQLHWRMHYSHAVFLAGGSLNANCKIASLKYVATVVYLFFILSTQQI